MFQQNWLHNESYFLSDFIMELVIFTEGQVSIVLESERRVKASWWVVWLEGATVVTVAAVPALAPLSRSCVGRSGVQCQGDAPSLWDAVSRACPLHDPRLRWQSS